MLSAASSLLHPNLDTGSTLNPAKAIINRSHSRARRRRRPHGRAAEATGAQP